MDFANRTFRIAFKTFCIGSFRNPCVPGETIASESCDTQPNCDTLFHDCHNAIVFTFFFFGKWPFFFSAFCFVVHQFCNEETNTCLPPYNPFLFYGIGPRADANIHKEFSCRCPSNNICTFVEQWIHGYFCLGCFSSPPHFYLAKGLALKLWRCVLAFAHDLGLRGGNWQRSPCEHWSFSFHW